MTMIAFALLGSSPAAGAEYHSAATHTTLKLVEANSQVITTPAATVTCKKTAGEGTVSAKTTEAITVSETYSECTAKTIFGNIAGSVEAKYCHFQWTKRFTFLHFTCETSGGGPLLTLSFPGCTLTLKSATFDGFDVVTVLRAGKLAVKLLKIMKGWTGTASGPFCSSSGEFSNGTMTGETVFQGSETSGTLVDFWYE